MKTSLLLCAAAWLSAAAAETRVAIIGAGAAGASTAYHLRQFADADGVALNITLFEKTDHIGGRTLTVDPYGDAAQAVELGASIFVEVNEILWNATDRFNLTRQAPGYDGVLGVWDGTRFVFTQNDRAAGWWNIVRLLWTYGTAPYRANRLMQATLGRFLELYRAPYFPFRSLTGRAAELELNHVTAQTGAAFLAAHGVGAAFAHDIVQASTRVNYAANLAAIHGLDTMVALAPSGASQVAGGNWQIFAHMADASGAAVRANTTVTALAAAEGQGQYVVTAKTAGDETGETASAEMASAETASAETFDAVVLAAPFQYSGIAAAAGVLPAPIDAIPYVELHVTLFASPRTLHPAFFGLAPGARVPSTVLTTLGPGDDPDAAAVPGAADQGAGRAGFFSISTLKTVVNPATQREEYLYKIFSPAKVTAVFLSALLGAEVPAAALGNADSASAAAAGPISWYYPHVFHSYPRALPRVTFQDPVLAPGLFYTSGIESFISTMETSALMGRNVARLIVDEAQGRATGGPLAAAAAGAEAAGSSLDEL